MIAMIDLRWTMLNGVRNEDRCVTCQQNEQPVNTHAEENKEGKLVFGEDHVELDPVSLGQRKSMMGRRKSFIGLTIKTCYCDKD